MDIDRSRLTRQLRGDSSWLAQIRSLAAVLRGARPEPGKLLVVGTPAQEPWHLVAHLDQEAQLSGQPQLVPTLVRHHVPAGAAPHLAIDLSRLESSARGETVFVIAPAAAPAELLTRVSDARRAGARILAIECGDPQLQGLAHETVTVADEQALRTDLGMANDLGLRFETTQHLVTLAAGQTSSRTQSRFQAIVDAIRRT